MSDHQQHLTRQRSPGNYPDRPRQWGRYIRPVAYPLSAHGVIVAPSSRTRWHLTLDAHVPLRRITRADLLVLHVIRAGSEVPHSAAKSSLRRETGIAHLGQVDTWLPGSRAVCHAPSGPDVSFSAPRPCRDSGVAGSCPRPQSQSRRGSRSGLLQVANDSLCSIHVLKPLSLAASSPKLALPSGLAMRGTATRASSSTSNAARLRVLPTRVRRCRTRHWA